MLKCSQILKCIGTKDAQSTVETSTKDLIWKQVVSVNHRVFSVTERSEIRALDLQFVGPGFNSPHPPSPLPSTITLDH